MKFLSLIHASMVCVVITAGSNTDGSAGSTGGTFSRLWGALETAGASLKEAGKATAEKVKRVGEAKIEEAKAAALEAGASLKEAGKATAEKVKRVGEAKIEKAKAAALEVKTAVEKIGRHGALKFVGDQLVVPAQQLVKEHKERLGAIVDALHKEAATGHALATKLQELKREGFVPLTDAQAVESCPYLPHKGNCLVDLKDCLNIRCPLAIAGVGSAFLGMRVNHEKGTVNFGIDFPALPERNIVRQFNLGDASFSFPVVLVGASSFIRTAEQGDELTTIEKALKVGLSFDAVVHVNLSFDMKRWAIRSLQSSLVVSARLGGKEFLQLLVDQVNHPALNKLLKNGRNVAKKHGDTIADKIDEIADRVPYMNQVIESAENVIESAQEAGSHALDALAQAGDKISAQLSAFGDAIGIDDHVSAITELVDDLCGQTGVECGGSTKGSTVTLATVKLPLVQFGEPLIDVE